MIERRRKKCNTPLSGFPHNHKSDIILYPVSSEHQQNIYCPCSP